MKKNVKKKGSAPKGAQRGNKFSIDQDPFFSSESRKRRKVHDDDEVESVESDDENGFLDSDRDQEKDGEAEDDPFEEETAGEKRVRMATEYLDKIREIARRKKEEEEEEEEDEDEGGRKVENQGERDSLVAQILQQEQLEETGRVRRVIASRVQKPEAADEFRVLVKHQQSVTAVALSDDDLKGFSASKDGTILHWDVESGKREKYKWPSNDVLRSHGVKDPQGRATRHSKHVLTLAVSSDGRYLASGGLDRHVHLWDTRTQEHIQAFPGHRGPVSCLTFRQGSPELFSGSYDRTVKIWNVEDRAYINTLFGHQSEVLGIDCLRKERVLTVGRDRSMQLWKVPEESRLIFRAPASSLESCCFIGNDEFLSGSDDGSIELWSVLRKKPVYIVRNAHASLANLERKENDGIPNGHKENGNISPNRYHSLSAYSWVNTVTVCQSSDLAASGAGNGFVRLWAIEYESKNVRPLYHLPLVGFVNSLSFSKSGKFLVAGVGKVCAMINQYPDKGTHETVCWVDIVDERLISIVQFLMEPRLGRWGRLPAAQNGVAIHPLELS